VLWGIWSHRDLTSGDTAEYFVHASQWAHSLSVPAPLWSPLYTVLWGSLRWFIHDPYPSLIVHRVLIALAVSLVVLAVLRRFVSPGIAWLLAVWWAVLPANYDVLYELHAFSILPEMAAVLIALTWKGLRMRTAVFSVLLTVAVLLRSEISFALLLWTAIWIGWELYERRQGQATPPRKLIAAVGVPVLVVGGVLALAVTRSRSHDPWGEFQGKQELNLCQSYAYGYQQRHHDFTASPWLDCGQLMERDFGRQSPTVTQAISANPSAVAEHVGWNARLAPYGLQLMLFDGISGDQRHDPDYETVTADSSLVLVGSILVIAFLAVGLTLLWRDRDRWWRTWIRPRAWGWVVLACLAATILPVLVIQRPRPEYLFGLSILILTLLGLSAMALVDCYPRLKGARAGLPIAAVLLVVLLPPHYGSGYETPNTGRPGRPLHDMVDRLYPMRAELRGRDVHLLATYSNNGCDYIGSYDPCSPIEWSTILPPAAGGDPNRALAAQGVDFIYVDSEDMLDPARRRVINQLSPSEWQRISPPRDQGWILFRRHITVPNANSTSSPT
jgi:hypothetical protein